MATGPQSGPQINVKHCPSCKGDLTPIPSKKQPIATSHRYQCTACKKSFEINDLG